MYRRRGLRERVEFFICLKLPTLPLISLLLLPVYTKPRPRTFSSQRTCDCVTSAFYPIMQFCLLISETFSQLHYNFETLHYNFETLPCFVHVMSSHGFFRWPSLMVLSSSHHQLHGSLLALQPFL